MSTIGYRASTTPSPEITSPTWTAAAVWIPPSASSPARVPDRSDVRRSRNASTPGVTMTTAHAMRKAGTWPKSNNTVHTPVIYLTGRKISGRTEN
ncbi:hypothetical protein Lesp01_29200 [Lentzea sp. NBRC 102530]|nr:hypothetical protein Lesp01_29200 [Lentzea sp. NBRC 102530]